MSSLLCILIVVVCLANQALYVHGASPSAAPSRSPTVSPTSAKPSPSPTRGPTASPTLFPTRFPTYTPTYIPTSAPTVAPLPTAVVIQRTGILTQHQLIVVKPSGDTLIKFKFYDGSTTDYKFAIQNLPASGSLYQLSQVFSNYGYEPKNGPAITNIKDGSEVIVTGSQNRVFYRRPNPDVVTNQKWGAFDVIGIRSTDGNRTEFGTITLVPPTGAIVGSNFLLNTEDWTITGNKASVVTPTYERYSRGALLNYYITGTDDVINVAAAAQPDRSLWYFEAPSKFFGNHGISYGGTIRFNIAAFSGDFSKLNDPSVNVIELHCATCEGPVGKGITLGYTIDQLRRSPNGAFDGKPKTISIALNEHGGWMKDSQNVLLPWTKPSKCDIIQVLSRLSKIKILGDWTTWYETVAIDDIQISNTEGEFSVLVIE